MTLILEAKKVRIEYGTVVALRDFSLSLAAGDLLGLIGPNGAGKTTCIKALAGLIPLAAGQVRVLGEPVEPGNTAALARIGFAPDNPAVYEELTVADFLRFIGRAYQLRATLVEERIDHWLEKLWLSDRRLSKIKTLSKGMRQRLTMARTFLPDPTLILLDEPAAGLDPAGRVEFRRILASLRDSAKALIVSSHILADLHEYCTHIMIMEAGSIMKFGTVAQFVGGSDNNRRLYDLALARPWPEAEAILRDVPGLRLLTIEGRDVSFEFDHDEQAASDLLKVLVLRGLPIARFGPRAHDLEQAYLRTGIRQVD